MTGQAVSDEELLAALEALQTVGSAAGAARAIGMDRSTFRGRIDMARLRGLHLSPGVQSALSTAGVKPGEARAGWRVVVDPETGSRDSVYWRNDPDNLSEDKLAEIRELFDGITPAPVIPAPAHTLEDLCTVWPFFDMHIGMHAWARETGAQDYDLKSAEADVRTALAKVLRITPDSEQGVLIIGGDALHADDNRSETPANKHKLDTDSRFWKVLETSVQILVDVVETLLTKHATLLVRILRGNHDEHSHMVLTFALAERYRDHHRVTVEKTPRDLFMFQWGRSSIFAHHGDKKKPQDLINVLADVCPFWSATRHRHCFTGHIHHDSAKDYPGIKWESLRAFCPPDAYGALYSPRRALQALTFDRRDGLVLRAMDPIEREE